MISLELITWVSQLMGECDMSVVWWVGFWELVFWKLRAAWQNVTQCFHTLHLSPLTRHSYGCHVFPASRHQLSLSFFFPVCSSRFSPSRSPFLSSPIRFNLPHRDRARAPASAHFERCPRPKNVHGKHTRAVFIINQLYGPLMEVISVKFMRKDLSVFS